MKEPIEKDEAKKVHKGGNHSDAHVANAPGIGTALNLWGNGAENGKTHAKRAEMYGPKLKHKNDRI